ncbi:hypothetical protein B5F07_02575 [Lachnoclostridium sp. An169]|uniref:DUF4422 domain-containing protein n=1 Tax=Lachnoclostridium sp. An169 TaxID=1965569 RepID=UPI000B380EDD|nr:DUF4422 domain-containing protein [Lachnoclostridium sp. An169]OUP86195.1 hypothetical protein B5F07_02575 [Lachnoclostridium sp. An169]
MSNIKLLICYHKPATLFKDEIMTPIHVGRANAKKRMSPDNKNLQWLMDNMIGDDTGENISEQNGTYNELTSLYWAWKNYDELGNPDYIGLMHYRRHFVWRENEHIVYNIENFNEETYLQEINYSPEKVHEMVDGCDFVAHIGKVINVYKHYVENHRKEDLDLAVEIMLEKHPEYKQVTEEYFAGDYSNFCNMFIFSREIFFQYCEWIFDILQEFEKRTDVSEKRFFISERLTGIFIANLMKNKSLKYKTIPISFIEDPVNIPVALPVNTENIYQTAHALTSILQAAKGYNTFQFYLLYRKGRLDETVKNKFRMFEEQYSFCRIEFVEMDIDEEYYPLFLSEKLPKVNKCIYAAGNFVVLQDLGEFFRICSTDDYYVVGTPSGKYDAFIEEKKLSPDILTLNCARLRKHNLWENAKVQAAQGKTGTEILNQLCEGQIGYIPWYFVTRESDYPYKDKILGDSKSRGQVQEEATWRAWLLYDEIAPWINSQGVYSIFWWDNAVHVPSAFGFVKVDPEKIEALYAKQQIEINTYTPAPPAVNEEWRSYSLPGKLRFFYQHNGLRKTITYSCKKAIKVLIGKEKISHA